MAMKLGDAAGSFTDINMMPLIDVMLVLLIIFIISLPPVTHAVKIDNQLPTNKPGIEEDRIHQQRAVLEATLESLPKQPR